MTDGCDYVAPVEQCCLRPVGHIRGVTRATFAQWLQQYILHVTQWCCRAIRAGFWPDCGRNSCRYLEIPLELVCRAE